MDPYVGGGRRAFFENFTCWYRDHKATSVSNHGDAVEGIFSEAGICGAAQAVVVEQQPVRHRISRGVRTSV